MADEGIGDVMGSISKGLDSVKGLIGAIKDLACALFKKCGKGEGKAAASANEKMEDMINLKAEKADGDELKDLTGVNPLDGGEGEDAWRRKSLRDDEEELLKNKRDGPLSPEEQFEADEEAKKRKLAPFADTGFDALRKMFEDDAQKRADQALKDSMRGDADKNAADKSILDAEKNAIAELDRMNEAERLKRLKEDAAEKARRDRMEQARRDMERDGLGRDRAEELRLANEKAAEDRNALEGFDADQNKSGRGNGNGDRNNAWDLDKLAGGIGGSDNPSDFGMSGFGSENGSKSGSGSGSKSGSGSGSSKSGSGSGSKSGSGSGGKSDGGSRSGSGSGSGSGKGGSRSGSGSGSGSGRGSGSGKGKGNGKGKDGKARSIDGASLASEYGNAAGGGGAYGEPAVASSNRPGADPGDCFYCKQMVHSAPNLPFQTQWCSMQDNPSACLSILGSVAESYKAFLATKQTELSLPGGYDYFMGIFRAKWQAVCKNLCSF